MHFLPVQERYKILDLTRGLFFPGVDQQQPLRQAMCVHPGWDAPKSYFCLTRATANGNHARDICRALIESDKYDIKIISKLWSQN